ncbi:MAG TPA: IS200/IS605 family transposase [Thermoanaerobaculia bacterium]|nr:IS200/IS605 family transposase [Thermoanaerobaculia bacterium]
MAHTYANLLYHFVFSTRQRVPWINDALRDPLYDYIGGIVRQNGGALLEIGGVPDHVHILARLKSDPSVATVIQRIKGKSSKWVNDCGLVPEGFRWQQGYGAFSVSESGKEKVRRYVRNQERHHSKVTFLDELITLLERHHIPYKLEDLLD